MDNMTIYVLAGTAWVLSILFGWLIGRPKGRGLEGALFGGALGIIGVAFTVALEAEGRDYDGSDDRYRIRDQRRRDRQLALMAGGAALTAFASVLILLFVALTAGRPTPKSAPPKYEFGLMHAMGGDFTPFNAAGESSFVPVSCRYVRDDKAAEGQEWGYECLFQRQVQTPE